MSTCLNPLKNHDVPEGVLICPTPNCGFLVLGAQYHGWQIKTLVRQSAIADLYLATSIQPNATQKIFVRILRRISPHASLALHRLLELRHPHIHTPFRGTFIEEHHVILLESTFEERGSLASLLARTGDIPLAAIGSSIRQAAEALHFAHERNVVHGRLKPENCLLVGSGNLQVGDFYYAFFGGSLRFVPSVYSAPEQRRGRMEPASDQFSLAVMSYLLLGKYLPTIFEGSHRFTGRGTVPSPQSLHAPLLPFPNPLDPVIQQALEALPSARFPDILSFATAIHTALRQLTPMLNNHAHMELSPAPPLASPSPRRFPSGARPGEREPPGSPLPSASPSLSGKSMHTSSAHFPSVGNPSPDSVSSKEYRLTAAPVCRLPGHTTGINVVRWAHDSVHLASASLDTSIRLWSVQHRIGRPLATLSGHSGRILALCWSPDNHLLLAASSDAAIRLWDVTHPTKLSSQALATWWGHEGEVYALDWSPDGALIASGGKDRMLRLWSPQGQKLNSWQAHKRGGVKTLAWSPDSRVIASGGGDKCIALWNASTGQVITEWEAHTDEVLHLVWSSDGQYLASYAGKRDRQVSIWNPRSGQLLTMLSGHTNTITGLFWSRDAHWLATLSADHTLRFWLVEQAHARQLGQPISIESTPQAVAGDDTSELIAVGMANLSILVLQVARVPT